MSDAGSSDTADGRTDPHLRRRYEILRSLLNKNGTALQLMSDLEADLNHLDYSETAVLRPARRLLDAALLMAQELNLLSSNRYRSLYGVIERIRRQLHAGVQAASAAGARPLSVSLSDDACYESRLVGGKAAGLAALRQAVPTLVPDGFVITTEAYRTFIRENGLADRIRILLADLDVLTGQPRFAERTRAITELILASPVPAAIRNELSERAAASGPSASTRWAVRSSALSEDERFSFAGQFDSKLDVRTEDLADAYRSVLASRFSNRAVIYRMHCGLSEADTPMAVLCMPMIDSQAAGVIYTRDPEQPASDEMVLAAVPGLADKMIRGEEQPEVTHLPQPSRVRPETGNGPRGTGLIPEGVAERLARASCEAARALGHDLDIEWALDRKDRLWLLQARRLRMSASEEIRTSRHRREPPLCESGYTLFPGRAEGPVEGLLAGGRTVIELKAPVLVIDQGTPEFAPLLPRIAALLIEQGSAVGHLATLAREFRVPSIYGLETAAKLLRSGEVVSVDATTRRIYRQSRWPGVREMVLSRLSAALERTPGGPLYDFILALNLTDPHGSSFRARNCRSVHDVVRFVHEMSIRSLFHFGDRQVHPFRKDHVKRLDSVLPMRLRLIDLDGSTPPEKRKLKPGDVASVPFQALWRGISDPRISWERRSMQHLNLDILPPEFVEEIMGGTEGPRRSKDANYAVVAADYVNLNARFVFHYAMLDAIVRPGKEGNHVHIRFRGGGASGVRRVLRARFLESVLRHLHFGVDRRGDLVTAWLQNHPRSDSERALELLGRLMGCSRQLDMFAASPSMMDRLVNRFLEEDYSAFA